jgi:molybdopterin/thiamine biosynthesis adenylyltransferase/proteasome lid subunit RPN8/RPN11
MSRLVFTKEMLSRLRSDLLESKEESCAILFGRSVEIDGKLTRIVVRESKEPSSSAYTIRTTIRAQLKPEFVAEAAQRARKNNESLIFVHTHPFSMNQFSEIDDDGERQLMEFLQRRIPNAAHAAMLITPEVTIARELGKGRELDVVSVGPEVSWSRNSATEIDRSRYDRQIRAFGASGQNVLKSLRVGIVGLGGTGSVVLQELAHLGVADFLLLDPDVVEESNLNRLVGAVPSDVGSSKVEVAKRFAQRINPKSQIETRQESVLKVRSVRTLADTDFVFCCTDSHGSRAVLNQFAYQYLIPMIDMGVVIAVDKSTVTHVAGRTQMLAPGLACMVCANLLDPEEIRRDLLTDFERQADPYILGNTEPAPAVISLNTTIASMAVTMFLNACTGIPGSARFVNYNAMTGVSRAAMCSQHPSCIVCSSYGAIARSEEWPLPARMD